MSAQPHGSRFRAVGRLACAAAGGPRLRGRRLPRRRPVRPAGAGALRAGGFILDDLESARARPLLEHEIGLAGRRRSSSSTPTRCAPASRRSRQRQPPRSPDVPGAVRRPGPVARALDAPGLDRRPHRLRRRPARPVGRRLARALPGRARRASRGPGLEVGLSGGPAFYGDVQAVSEADLRRSELISLPLAALALLLVFGSRGRGGVPLAVGGARWSSRWPRSSSSPGTPMSIFVLNLATLLGLGLGVDYSLLMTSRFREELAGARLAARRGRRRRGRRRGRPGGPCSSPA